MKKIIACLIAALLTIFIPHSAFASTNDFYFKDATFDYYLTNSDSGTTMHVREVLTAVFPEINQNHGITRAIPFTNLDGKNITVENTAALNLSVTRNGVEEQIAKIDHDEDELIVYIGSSSEYVHGEQVYVLEYDFHNVITEFAANGDNLTGQQSDNVAYQELYWDTNGTGWSQRFDHLTANLHIPRDQAKALLGDQTSCYVGYYGQGNNGQKISSRCSVTSDDETTYSPGASSSINTITTPADTAEIILSFETTNLAARENLSFAVDFKPGTFTVPELSKNYTLVTITTVVAGICLLIIAILLIIYFKKAHKKRQYYKGLFETPEYTPLEGLDIAASDILSIKKTTNSQVATLLELAVAGKVSIKKGEPTKHLKKDTWKLKINNITNLTESQKDLLELLSGGTSVEKLNDTTIDVKKHTPTRELEVLSNRYENDARHSLKALGYLKSKSKNSGSIPQKEASTKSDTTASDFFNNKIWPVITFVIVGLLVLSPLLSEVVPKLIKIDLSYGDVVGKEYLPIVIVATLLITIALSVFLISRTVKYAKYTEKGLDAANYLDGLRLYISMAEADRLKFLQSAKGADTSKEGIVKLYEKLLPYACLFGLEESWLKEFNKYCKDVNYSPTWYYGDDFITYYALSSMSTRLNSAIDASSSYSSTSSGSSSFSSGGGGGGFSGGGGGGGGGGGW